MENANEKQFTLTLTAHELKDLIDNFDLGKMLLIDRKGVKHPCHSLTTKLYRLEKEMEE